MPQGSIPSDAIFGLVAYGVGVFAAAIPLHIIVSAAWSLVEAEAVKDRPHFWYTTHDALKRYVWQGDLVGAVERLLYVSALVLAKPEFLAVWLTLKTIARSPRWTEEAAIKGRALFNVFLVGNGLSILFSAFGYGLAIWVAGPSWFREPRLAILTATAVSLITICACIWLVLLLRHKHNALETLQSLPDEGFLEIVGRPRGAKKPKPPA